MSPNLRRYLPFIVGALLLLILISALSKKGSSTTTVTPSAQSTETVQALDLVDRSEQLYQSAHGRYTEELADLLVESHGIAQDLAEGMVIQLNVGSNGQSYYALVQSPVLTLVRARDDRKLLAESCVIDKSESGVSCPGAKSSSS